MTSEHSFTVASRAKAKEKVKEYPEIVFPLTEELEPDAPADAVEKTRRIVAHFPGEGLMTQLIATMGVDAGMGDQLGAMYSFLKHAVSASDYAYIRKQQAEGRLGSDVVLSMSRIMLAEWSTFPTQPSSGSASGQPATGTRSTGKLQPGE